MNTEVIQNEPSFTEEEARKYKLSLRECILGDRHFYKKVAAVVLPIIVQNTLSNIVSLLDNVMVGQVGTVPMSAVAIVNQLFFVVYLCIWGSLSGAGIYGTQYYGKGDIDGMQTTIRFKIVDIIFVLTVAILVFIFAGNALVKLYISSDTSPEDAAETLRLARQYMLIMLIGFIPFGFGQVLAGTMRESGKTMLPMKASITAMFVNFVFNALLIFGLLGFPKLGVCGAAVATVISRFVEFAIIAFGAKNKEKYPFFRGVLKNFRIPKESFIAIFMKSLPLLINECMWALGMAVLLQCYSVRGLAVIAAMNISNTIAQIFNEVFISLGNATSIICGQELGANRLVEARRSSWRIMSLSIVTCIGLGGILFMISSFIPHIYNVEPEIKEMASDFIKVLGICMPINGFANIAYFTIRSGGRVFITILFDSCFTWVVSVPAAYLLAHFTKIPVLEIYLFVSLLELGKCFVGFMMVKKGIWVRNIVQNM
ncbi:MAG: MATE family efflux transporter [Lachnospiraceae bacterium]|nr:MATE family efflux transporter [Lachnospiraceae bacterium]